MNPAQPAILAMQHAGEEQRRTLFQQWSVLMLLLVLLSVILITALAFLIARRRARARIESLPKPPEPSIPDAWTEAGKRIDESITQTSDE